MKIIALTCAILAASVSAFAPEVSQRSTTALNSVDRRTAFGLVAAAVVAAPQIASADGAVSGATINRARMQYGGRIADLKSAVDKGDLAAVAAEKNAFILFNSGAYPRVVDKKLRKDAIKQTNAIFAAVKTGDKGALKTAYSTYVANNDIRPIPTVDPNEGQGYSGDFDYRVKTKAAAIYVR